MDREKKGVAKAHPDSNHEDKRIPRTRWGFPSSVLRGIILSTAFVLIGAALSYMANNPKILYLGAAGLCLLILYLTHSYVRYLEDSAGLQVKVPPTTEQPPSSKPSSPGAPSANNELPPPHKAPPPKPPKTSGTFKELPPLEHPEKKPTFKEILGPYKVIVGSNIMILSEKNTKENPMHLIKFGDWASLDAYVDEGKLYVDALLFGDYNRPAVTIRHNEFTSPPQNWDRNYDDSALEIVDGNLIPRFQLIYRDQRTVVINGVYQYPGGLVVMTNDGMMLNPLPPLKVSMRRIFEYPSRLYQGQEITPQ